HHYEARLRSAISLSDGWSAPAPQMRWNDRFHGVELLRGIATCVDFRQARQILASRTMAQVPPTAGTATYRYDGLGWTVEDGVATCTNCHNHSTVHYSFEVGGQKRRRTMLPGNRSTCIGTK